MLSGAERLLLDALIAGAVLAFSRSAIAHGGFAKNDRGLDVLGGVLAALTVLPLAARRLAPLPVFVFVTAATATLYGFRYGLDPPIAFAIALDTSPSSGRPRTRACARAPSPRASSSCSRRTSSATASRSSLYSAPSSGWRPGSPATARGSGGSASPSASAARRRRGAHVRCTSDPREELPQLMRPVVDAFWQAGGWPTSPDYNHDGTWREGR